MGINQAIDMDNIIRSVDGDMAIVMPSLTDNNMQMTMLLNCRMPSGWAMLIIGKLHVRLVRR